jgi:hypothetical protein
MFLVPKEEVLAFFKDTVRFVCRNPTIWMRHLFCITRMNAIKIQTRNFFKSRYGIIHFD